MIIAIDFDGTLHTGSYPSIGSPKPGAVKYLKKIKEDGHYIIIWTCREDNKRKRMEEWLKNNGISYDRINDNHPDKIKEYGNNSRKIYADIYIDDKNILGIPSWKEIYTIISQKRSKKSGLLLESLYLRGIHKSG